MRRKLDYNLNWGEYFKIDETSPSGLVRIKTTQGTAISQKSAGTKVLNKSGEPTGWQLRFKNTLYFVHRIVWVLSRGSINNDLVVDHLDGNPLNNSINNLSLKTQKNNLRNSRKNKNNKTGVTGVTMRITRDGYRYYVAEWYDIDGSYRRKHFSVLKLGEETAKSLAITHRNEQIQRLISEGADYTERHGI